MISAYLQLFYIFFKIGIFSFGGGYVMLPMIYKEIQNFNLIPVQEFADIVALSQMTPGPIAVNAATYVGYKYAGFWGAAFATLGVSLPSLILILIISAFFYKFKTSALVNGIFSGIRPATVGMIASAVLFFSESSIFRGKLVSNAVFEQGLNFIDYKSLVIFALTILCIKKTKMGPITLTVLAGIAGAFFL